jgi:limonene-1,2-epoxide hydrolase
MPMTDEQRIEVARAMLAAWDAIDLEAAVALFAEDAVLHSVMDEPVVGRDLIRAHIGFVLDRCTRCELRVKSIGVIGGRVFVERVDDFDFDGHHGVVPVVGIMTIEDGLVTEWLEYYDRPTLLAGLGVAPGRA